MSENAPPHDVSMVAHAQIAAAMAEGKQSQRDILRSVRLTETQWTEATSYWMQRLVEDAKLKGAETQLAIEYSAEFAAAQDRLGATPEMSPEEWARLTVEIQTEGSTTEPLARRNFSLADYLRLARLMAKRLSSIPAEQKRFMNEYVALQPPDAPNGD